MLKSINMNFSYKGKPLFALIVTVFLDMFAYGIMLPLIPVLLNDPSSPAYLLPAGMSINTGYVILGFILGAQPLMQFFAAPILGQLSDKYGRRKVLIISLLGTCISHALFAYAIMTKDIPLLFISRAIDGITGGNISVAQAAVSDISTLKDRTKNFGIIGAAFGLGFIIGPFIGGVLSDPHIFSWFSISTPFWFSVILSALNTLLVYKFLPETHKDIDDTKKLTWWNSIRHIRKAFTLPGMRSIFISQFMYYTGFSFFTTFFSVFLITRLSYNQTQIGAFFAYVGLWLIVTQVIIIRFVLKDAKEKSVLPFSMLMSGLGIILLLTVSNTWVLCIIIPLFAVANGVTIIHTTSIISKSASPKIQGEVLGLGASVQALAQSISPILSGFTGKGMEYIATMKTASAPNIVLFISGSLMVLASVTFIVFHNIFRGKDGRDF